MATLDNVRVKNYMVRHWKFDNVEDFLTTLTNRPIRWADGCNALGGKDVHEGASNVRNAATPERVAQAEALFERIDGSFERAAPEWTAAPYGAFPIVPDYLAGDPFSMRTKSVQVSDSAPLRYFVEASVSAGVGTAQMDARAIALAALIAKTAEHRATELLVYCADRVDRSEIIISVVIPTRPLDIAGALGTLCGPAFNRGLVFHAESMLVGAHESPPNMVTFGLGGSCGSKQREDNLRIALRADPQDVIIQGGHMDDAAEFERYPVQWVHKQIAKQRSMDNG